MSEYTDEYSVTSADNAHSATATTNARIPPSCTRSRHRLIRSHLLCCGYVSSIAAVITIIDDERHNTTQ